MESMSLGGIYLGVMFTRAVFWKHMNIHKRRKFPNIASILLNSSTFIEFEWKKKLSIFVISRYLQLKFEKNKEINKKLYATFENNFKNVHLCVMSNISFEKYHFVLHVDDRSLIFQN